MAHRPGSGQPPEDQQPYGQQWASQQPRGSWGRQYAPQDRQWQPQQQDAPWQRYGPAQEQWEPTPAPGGQPQRAPQQSVREHHGRSPGFLYAGIGVVIGVVIGGAGGYALHGSTPAATSTANAAAATTPPARTAPAVPDTAAAAKSTAAQFFALYSAGQWAPAWQYLTAADKAEAPLSVYTAVHQGCPSKAAGLAYKIQQVNKAGKTAVVTYSLSGVASAIGSGTIAETWTAAGWTINPNEMSIYSHGSASADLAAARAAGDCAS